MSDDTGPRSCAERFWRMCLSVFSGVVLLVLTIELITQYWLAFAIAMVVAIVIVIAVWWWRRRNTW